MLYKKNREKTLSPELFREPTSEYRGTPFWAWNCRLEKDELLRQLDVMKETLDSREPEGVAERID